MTDNEIIKAFDCCNNKTLDCDECPCHYKQEKPCLELDNLVFDLINRQQAELERLKKSLSKQMYDFETEYDSKIKAEAYKEFAERLCEDRVSNDPVVIAAKVELKELVGEQNG